MESQHQKWVTISYIAVAALVAYVFSALAFQLAGTFDWEAKLRNIDVVIPVASIVVGAILFFVLYRNDRTNQFMNEVVVELSRVTWPSQKETVSATIVVLIMVLISGLILGALDYLWTVLLQWIL